MKNTIIYSATKPTLQGKADRQYIPTWNVYTPWLTNPSEQAINHNLDAKLLRLKDEIENTKAKQKLFAKESKKLETQAKHIIEAEKKGVKRKAVKVGDIIYALVVDPPKNDCNHIPRRTYAYTKTSILMTAYYRNENMELIHNEEQAVHVIAKRACASDLIRLKQKLNPTLFASYQEAEKKALEYDQDKAGAEEIYQKVDKKALRAYYGLK